MNAEIYALTERLREQLGVPNPKTVSSTTQDITYKNVRYAVTFYKVTTNGGVSYFWVCNPFHIVPYVSNQINPVPSNI